MNIFSRSEKASGSQVVESPSFPAAADWQELSSLELEAVGGGDVVGNYDGQPKP